MNSSLWKIFSLVFFLEIVQFSRGAKWPSDLERCRNEDSSCISRVATGIIKRFASGRSDIGLPRFEPLFVPKIVVSEGGKGSLNLDLTFLDLTVEGLSGVTVEQAVGFSKNPSNSKFEFHGFLPKLHLKGKYEAGGRILVLPIQGKGNSDILFENVKCSFKFKPNLVTRNGKQFIEVSKLKIFLDPQSMKTKLDNLFNGDKALGDNMNKFLNENWKDVWTEVGPNVNIAVAKVIKDKIGGVFQTFPYADVFKP